MKFTLY